jgi:ubiquinone/menaquinone biosynthesis C-methylase UbiE
MSVDLIRQYYEQLVHLEWERLGRHPMEFAITRRALKQWMPSPPADVLDCGSGPGRYALMLARRGYRVSLLDLAQGSIDYAVERFAEEGLAYVSAEQGDATDLSRYPSESFDTVLMLGPLYHLTNEADRYKALGGALRILRPGGMLFAAFLSRYAILRYAIRNHPELILEAPEQLEVFWNTGSLIPRREDGREFISYAIHPKDIAPLLDRTGFRMISQLGVEGLTSHISEKLNQASQEVLEAWVDLNYEVASDPSILGCVEHLLAVARKRH